MNVSSPGRGISNREFPAAQRSDSSIVANDGADRRQAGLGARCDKPSTANRMKSQRRPDPKSPRTRREPAVWAFRLGRVVCGGALLAPWVVIALLAGGLMLESRAYDRGESPADGRRQGDPPERRPPAAEDPQDPAAEIVLRVVGPGDDEPLGPGDDEPLGPGDDEPLTPACGSEESSLRMNLLTNYAGRATVLVTSDGSYITSRPLHSDGASRTPIDQKTSLYSLPISLDLEWLQSALGRSGLSTPYGGVLHLDLTLYSFPDGRLISSRSFRSNVRGRPWLECEDPLAPRAPGDHHGHRRGLEGGEIDEIPAGVDVVLHIPARAGYFLLLGAFDPGLLDASPQNPANLSQVEVLSGGSMPSNQRSEVVRTVDSPLLNRNAPPYLAVWIYNDADGWCRSAVSLVP